MSEGLREWEIEERKNNRKREREKETAFSVFLIFLIQKWERDIPDLTNSYKLYKI